MIWIIFQLAFGLPAAVLAAMWYTGRYLDKRMLRSDLFEIAFLALAAPIAVVIVSIVMATISVTTKVYNFLYNQLNTKTNFIKWLDEGIQK